MGGIRLKRSNERRVSRLKLIVVLSAIPVLIAALFLAARLLDQRSQKPEPRSDHTQRYQYETLTELDGVTYRQRRDVTTILLMGVDVTSSGANPKGYRNGGQADFLRLLIIDDAEKSVTQLQIDRDTMTPITVLGIMGNKSGMRTAQVSLSHGFGDGKEQSCLLTAEAVSNLLYGVPIDGYVAMNLDGISVLNDMAGGISVTLEDDFSSLDPTMTKGKTLTLMGDQAEYFVRSRMTVGIGTNEARMVRQELYLSQLMDQLTRQVKSDEAFLDTLYDALSPYLTTNLSRGRLINEVYKAMDYANTNVVKMAGEHKIGADGFMQFWFDEAALKKDVTRLFYKPLK